MILVLLFGEARQSHSIIKFCRNFIFPFRDRYEKKGKAEVNQAARVSEYLLIFLVIYRSYI